MDTNDIDISSLKSISEEKFREAVLYMLIINNSLLQRIIDYQLNGTPVIEDLSQINDANKKMFEWLGSTQKLVLNDLITRYGNPA